MAHSFSESRTEVDLEGKPTRYIWCIRCGRGLETVSETCAGAGKQEAPRSGASQGEKPKEVGGDGRMLLSNSDGVLEIRVFATKDQARVASIAFAFSLRAFMPGRLHALGYGKGDQAAFQAAEYLLAIRHAQMEGKSTSAAEKAVWEASQLLPLRENALVFSDEKFKLACRGDALLEKPYRLDIRDFAGNGRPLPTKSVDISDSDGRAIRTATPAFRYDMIAALNDFGIIMHIITGCESWIAVPSVAITHLNGKSTQIIPDNYIWYVLQKAMVDAFQGIKDSKDAAFKIESGRAEVAAAIAKDSFDGISWGTMLPEAFDRLLASTWPSIEFHENGTSTGKRKKEQAAITPAGKKVLIDIPASPNTRSASKSANVESEKDIMRLCLRFLASHLKMTTSGPGNYGKPKPIVCDFERCRFKHDDIKRDWTQEEVVAMVKAPGRSRNPPGGLLVAVALPENRKYFK
jgi:hypothetical protein